MNSCRWVHIIQVHALIIIESFEPDSNIIRALRFTTCRLRAFRWWEKVKEYLFETTRVLCNHACQRSRKRDTYHATRLPHLTSSRGITLPVIPRTIDSPWFSPVSIDSSFRFSGHFSGGEPSQTAYKLIKRENSLEELVRIVEIWNKLRRSTVKSVVTTFICCP